MHRSLDHRPQQQAEAGDRQQRAERVGPLRVGVERVGDERDREREPEQRDRHVDQEHRAPGEVREQQPADDRAERDAGSRGRRPDAERSLALTGDRVNVFVMIDSVAGMISVAPMPMLARAAISIPDEPENAAQTEHDGEDREPGAERPLAPDSVREAAGDEHQPAEHERVRVDDPLQLAIGRVQVAHERRQRDVEDGAIERDDQQRHAQDGEREPAAVARRPYAARSAGRRVAGLLQGRRPARRADRRGGV